MTYGRSGKIYKFCTGFYHCYRLVHVEHTRHVPAELLANPEVKKPLYNSGMRKGMQRGLQKGMQKGLERGMQKGLERGRAEEKESVARNLKRMRLDSETISRATGLARDVVDRL